MIDKERVNNVLRALNERKIIDSYLEIGSLGDLFEDSEYIPFGESEKLLEQNLDERSAVTFGGKPNPRDGWSCILSGGPGSGKGFSLKKQILISGKTIDVDELKKFYKFWFRVNRDKALKKNPEYRPANGREFEMGNPDDVFTLHKAVQEMGWKDNIINNFTQSNGTLQNIIFDITGKKVKDITSYAKQTKKLGYNVSLVWVITNRMWAMFRNVIRKRVVPQEVFHNIHNMLKDSVFKFLDVPNIGKVVDEVWVVFAGGAGTSLKPEIEVDTTLDLENTVMKIKKQGNNFVVPEKLKRKIIAHLGPNEDDPENSSRYDDFDTVKQKIEPYKYWDEDDEKWKYKGYEEDGIDLLKQDSDSLKFKK